MIVLSRARESPHGYDDHKNKAQHDESAASLLCLNPNVSDWSITCAFYCALHCVDAYAHRLGVRTFEPQLDEQISAHTKRKKWIWRNLRNLFSIYGRLYSRSEQCRYDPKYYLLMEKDLPEKMLREAKKFLQIL